MELLTEDRARVQQTLLDLVRQQEQRIEELKAALARDSVVLDQNILRTMVFRNLFGSTQTETLTSETDTEEASKPVTEKTRQIERETQILQAYQVALKQLEAGAPMEQLGKPASSSAP
jgi:hypothetical protein